MIKEIAKYLLTTVNRIRYIKRVQIDSRCTVYGKLNFEGHNHIFSDTYFVDSSLGTYSYIGQDCIFYKAKIGKYSSISSHVSVFTGNHPSTGFVSTYPAFFSTKHECSFVEEDKFDEELKIDDANSIIIGNDVWIGAHVILKGGIKIGDGAIIAAGAVVTKDVAPYTIVGGVPAKLIRDRFSDVDKEFLLKLCWWNKSIEWIKKHAEGFENIQLLKEEVNRENNY